MLLVVVAALIAVGVGLATYGTKLFQSVELSTVDSRFSVRGTEKPPADLVVVGIDPQTQLQLNEQWPFPRDFHAKVIDRLKADGAKVIAVDIAISQPSKQPPKFCAFAGANFPPDDCALLNSSAHAGNLVFSATEVGAEAVDPVRGPDCHPRDHEAARRARRLHRDRRRPRRLARRYLYGFNGLKSFAVAVVERETGHPVTSSIFTADGRLGMDRLLRAARHDPRGPVLEGLRGQDAARLLPRQDRGGRRHRPGAQGRVPHRDERRPADVGAGAAGAARSARCGAATRCARRARAWTCC